jgi:peptidoglycan/LPS O-acetylase OafA/YrhL
VNKFFCNLIAALPEFRLQGFVKRYPGLDLLRTLAILWVLLFHAATEGLGQPLGSIGHLGWIGVDLFFVLSGFLIGSQFCQQYARGETPAIGPFYLRRAFRILPAYWAVLALYFCFPVFREASGMQPFWQFLSFTENLLVNSELNRTFSHAWSLCVEEHFYLIFPWLVWVLMRHPSAKVTATVCLVIFGIGLLLRAYIWLHYLDPALEQPGNFVEMIYYPTYTRLDGLMAGVGLAVINWFRPQWWARAMDHPYKILAAGLVSFGFALWIVRHRADFGANVFGFPALALSMALIVVACISPQGLPGKYAVPGAKAIASITFSLYLSHKLSWHLVRTYAPGLVRHGGFQAFIVYTAAAFFSGTILYLAVERPFLHLRDRVGRKPQRSGAA